MQNGGCRVREQPSLTLLAMMSVPYGENKAGTYLIPPLRQDKKVLGEALRRPQPLRKIKTRLPRRNASRNDRQKMERISAFYTEDRKGRERALSRPYPG